MTKKPATKTKKPASKKKEPLHVCVDRPVSTLNVLHRMYHAIKNNPANNPAEPGTEEHGVVKKFIENPHQQLSPEHHLIISRLALAIRSMWHKGQTLTVAFLDGSALQKKKTKKYAKYWTDKSKANANIKLKFVSGKKAMIRISFIADPGSWSTVGTDCSMVPANQPTMNFGWLRNDSEEAEWQRVVVHEFGHAMGCIHEHQSPAVAIKWNKPAVYKYFEGPPNNWSKADVDNNIFDKYNKTQTQFTAFDITSIMLYFFPPEFTLDRTGTPENNHLSATDISFIRTEYPH
jgi:serralysin